MSPVASVDLGVSGYHDVRLSSAQVGSRCVGFDSAGRVEIKCSVGPGAVLGCVLNHSGVGERERCVYVWNELRYFLKLSALIRARHSASLQFLMMS